MEKQTSSEVGITGVNFIPEFTGDCLLYSPGTNVTRENFASFLADTFQTSRGSAFIQYAWLAYLDALGTNALQTMKNV